jgi:hypothetical protein
MIVVNFKLGFGWMRLKGHYKIIVK